MKNNLKLSYINDKKKSEIRKLWENIFNDSQEFLEFYFDIIIKKNTILIMEFMDEIIGMIHLNPYKLILENREYNGEYIVAVCVKEEFRNMGLMKEMFSLLEERMNKENIDIYFLMPENKDYYLGQGFETLYNNSILTINENIIDIFNEKQDYIKQAIVNIMSVESTIKNIDCINSKLSENFNLFVKRDIDYIYNLKSEIEYQKGEVYTIFYQNKLIAYFTFILENKTKGLIEHFTVLSNIEIVLYEIFELVKKLELNSADLIVSDTIINSLQECLTKENKEKMQKNIVKFKGIMVRFRDEKLSNNIFAKINNNKLKTFFDEII